jgi:hypothetical protein
LTPKSNWCFLIFNCHYVTGKLTDITGNEMLKPVQGKTSATAPAQETVIVGDPLPSASRLPDSMSNGRPLQKKTARSLA